jgi:hypothetical protein
VLVPGFRVAVFCVPGFCVSGFCVLVVLRSGVVLGVAVLMVALLGWLAHRNLLARPVAHPRANGTPQGYIPRDRERIAGHPPTKAT